MNFTQAVRSCFSKFATFQGRAQRSEFWYFALFTNASYYLLVAAEYVIFGLGDNLPAIASPIFTLIVFIPTIAVSVRRLHDLDRTGWWWWRWLIPIIGWIVLLVWMISKGSDGDNAYGPDPLGGWADIGEVQSTHASSIPHVSRDD